MAPAEKSTTPGRRKRTDNQYFDVGKVGRKTGITLKDTGIRDEHGLEPVSGIFSSPGQSDNGTLTSEGMDVEESSAPDVTATLTHRKTPRLPPPRQSTPRHTNIGSPKRMSSVKPTSRADPSDEHDSPRQHEHPPANRKLDFGATNRNRKSISVVDTQSPFKPRKVLRRSTGPARPDPFALPIDDDDDDATAQTSVEHTYGELDENEDVEPSIEGNDQPTTIDEDDSYPVDMEQIPNDADEIEASVPVASPMRRKRGRPRKSDQSINSSQVQHTPTIPASASSKKRTRDSLENSHVVNEGSVSATEGTAGPLQKKKRSSNADNVIIHRDQGTEVVDPSVIAYGDEFMVNEDSEIAQTDAQSQLDAQLETQQQQQEEEERQKSAGKGRGRPKGRKGKAAASKERDVNRTKQRKGSPVKVNGSPSKRYRGGSVGPVSNVSLRATTPAVDAGVQSRYGRNLIQPLRYWENESLIWKNGEIEGIVRADPVEKPKLQSTKRRRKGRKRAGGGLTDIAEESDTESTIPDEWEEEMGVISGVVARWNHATKSVDPGVSITEDLAFAASAIITRDVAGSEFKYAKIMTIPFFGAGVVEIPPEGFKSAKNSRRMQMVFFVHEGKVMVEVGAAGMEVNQFALSKGGVWVVPRGNNYAITNESRTKTAKMFFAQGSVVDDAE